MPDIGDLKHRAAAVIPAGWLLCDGREVSRATYAALFGVIGTAWGAGNGTTTFNLPDLRGRSLLGNGTGPGLTNRVLGTSGGEENHLLVEVELASHLHAITDPGHLHDVPVDATGATAGGTSVQGSSNMTSVTVSPGTATKVTGITATEPDGFDVPHNTMHPWAAGYPLIYAGV